MFEISIVSPSNDRCDHCNRKCNNQYENDNQIYANFDWPDNLFKSNFINYRSGVGN